MSSSLKNREKEKKQPLVCELDLTRIQGNGDFPCPNCGVTLSPEDETEDVYCILEAKVEGQALEELVIQCNKCASQIRLIGFPILHIAQPVDTSLVE
ncbi:MAG: hypothetical protein JSV05_03500 [Candidatus Bathyarchaeota archaeon]|nr:MAG: hypothetical protein JSV05_03500 [Candidatus Bathyarchaeota archaeon]